MSDLVIREYEEADQASVVALWEAAGLVRPWNDPVQDIALCCDTGHGVLFLAEIDGVIAGSVMAGHDGHRGWLYYVAVDPAQQKRGIGSLMVATAEAWLGDCGIRKVMLMIRPDNTGVQAFYAGQGYEVEERVIMSRRIDEDDGPDEFPGELIGTA